MSLAEHEGGELVFHDGGRKLGVGHKRGVGIIHLGSAQHQVTNF